MTRRCRMKLVLDLGGVTFMDSSGIALDFASPAAGWQALGGNLHGVSMCRDQARRVLDAAGIEPAWSPSAEAVKGEIRQAYR